MDGSYLVPGGDYPCVSVVDKEEMTLNFTDVILMPSVGNGLIDLTFPEYIELSGYSVCDQNGRWVYSISQSMNSPQRLDFSSLENGVYFLTLRGSSGSSVTKKIQIIR